ncbi:MAG: nucleotidyltransferase domain-containing protein [Elusimicrobiota bacterium]
MNRKNAISILKKELPYLINKYGVQKIGVFGSTVKNKSNIDSDVDIFVKFSKPIGLEFVDFCEYLEQKLGKAVDVITPDGLEGIRVERVKKEMKEELKNNLIYV